MTDQGVISVRPATETDVGEILRFIKALAEFEKLSDQVVASESALHAYLFGARPVAEALIATLDHRPAGFALFFPTFSTFLAKPGLWLEDLFVLPEFRGRGIGRMLLRRVAELVVNREFGRLEWSVLDWNESAIRLYRKVGADLLDDWTICRLTGDSLRELAAGKTAAQS